MDVQQIRKLKPKLKRFLALFDDCFPARDTLHLPVYVSGQLSNIPEKSVEPIAAPRQRCRSEPSRSFSASTTGSMTKPRPKLQEIVRDETTSGPMRSGFLTRPATSRKGDKTPGVQRQWCGAVGKKGELHRHSSPGLRPRRLSLSARRRIGTTASPGPTAGARCREAGIPDDADTGPSGRSPWNSTTARSATACTSTG